MTAPAPLVQLRQDGEVYTSAEVGALFGVTDQTVSRWARQGRIDRIRMSRRSAFYRAGQVNQLLRDRGLLAPAEELPGQFALPL